MPVPPLPSEKRAPQGEIFSSHLMELRENRNCILNDCVEATLRATLNLFNLTSRSLSSLKEVPAPLAAAGFSAASTWAAAQPPELAPRQLVRRHRFFIQQLRAVAKYFFRPKMFQYVARKCHLCNWLCSSVKPRNLYIYIYIYICMSPGFAFLAASLWRSRRSGCVLADLIWLLQEMIHPRISTPVQAISTPLRAWVEGLTNALSSVPCDPQNIHCNCHSNQREHARAHNS